jgi:hypothetical protein
MNLELNRGSPAEERRRCRKKIGAQMDHKNEMSRCVISLLHPPASERTCGWDGADPKVHSMFRPVRT